MFLKPKKSEFCFKNGKPVSFHTENVTLFFSLWYKKQEDRIETAPLPYYYNYFFRLHQFWCWDRIRNCDLSQTQQKETEVRKKWFFFTRDIRWYYIHPAAYILAFFLWLQSLLSAADIHSHFSINNQGPCFCS